MRLTAVGAAAVRRPVILASTDSIEAGVPPADSAWPSRDGPADLASAIASPSAVALPCAWVAVAATSVAATATVGAIVTTRLVAFRSVSGAACLPADLHLAGPRVLRPRALAPCLAVPCLVAPCFVVCLVVLSLFAVLCFVVLCFVVLCFVVLRELRECREPSLNSCLSPYPRPATRPNRASHRA